MCGTQTSVSCLTGPGPVLNPIIRHHSSLFGPVARLPEDHENQPMKLAPNFSQLYFLMSVLLYSAETWTLLSADVKTLDAFHMKCQRQILDIRWWQHISNADVLQRSGLPLMTFCLIVASPCSVTLPAWTQVCRRMLPFS